MAIIVEDGSIVAGANSYVSESELTTYCTNRGVTLTGTASQLLLLAMDYIESLAFIGVKRTKDQPLVWPRYRVYVDGYYLNEDEIPVQLKNGVMECAIAIDQGNSPLIDLPRATKREKVGDLEVEYMDKSSSVITNRKVNSALKKLLANGGTLAVGKG